jgi:hypothetical protein
MSKPSQKLKSLQPIKTVLTLSPLTIVPAPLSRGLASTDDELMVRKVDWAIRAGFEVLTRDVPASFAPFNAVIRINDRGTEDADRDYLAVLDD